MTNKTKPVEENINHKESCHFLETRDSHDCDCGLNTESLYKPVEEPIWEKELANVLENRNMPVGSRAWFIRQGQVDKDLIKFISSLLQEQAEHFVKLGEELRKKPDEEALRLRGMDRMSERYLSASVEAVKFHGYNQGISDFQKAIKKEGK